MAYSMDLKQVERRARAAAVEDGSLEILLGAFLVSVGAMLDANRGLTPLLVFAVFLVRPLQWLKRRFVYPRIGYSKLPSEQNATARGIGVAAILFTMFLLGAMAGAQVSLGETAGRDFFLKWVLSPATGFMLAIGPLWFSRTYGVKRGYVFAAACALGGVVLPVLGIAEGYAAISLLAFLLGLLSLVVGAILFFCFLRRYSPAKISAKEDKYVE